MELELHRLRLECETVQVKKPLKDNDIAKAQVKNKFEYVLTLSLALPACFRTDLAKNSGFISDILSGDGGGDCGALFPLGPDCGCERVVDIAANGTEFSIDEQQVDTERGKSPPSRRSAVRAHRTMQSTVGTPASGSRAAHTSRYSRLATGPSPARERPPRKRQEPPGPEVPCQLVLILARSARGQMGAKIETADLSVLNRDENIVSRKTQRGKQRLGKQISIDFVKIRLNLDLMLLQPAARQKICTSLAPRTPHSRSSRYLSQIQPNDRKTM